VSNADELDLLKALLCGCYEVSGWDDLDENVKVRGDGGDGNCKCKQKGGSIGG
jgi:hypothetical protein